MNKQNEPAPAQDEQQGLRIVFDGPPGPEAGRFVEVENASGCSVNSGEWRERTDGLWELVLHAAALSAVTAERDRLANEAERLRMQLAACGVVAMANTPESSAKSREMHPDYMSASCQDVMRAVDSEMSLRAEVETLRKDVERYRWLRNPDQDVALVLDKLTGHVPVDWFGGGYPIYEYRAGEELDAAIDAAMAAKEE